MWKIIKELQAEIADQKTELESKEAEIKRLQKFVAQNTELEAKEAELKSKEAEIQRLQKLVDQLSSDRRMP